MRGSESRLRHVLSELGQWVSPPLRVVHLLRRTHREALALSGSANGVTVDPATACMWPVRLPCARLPATLCLVPLVLFESKSCSQARGIHSIFFARDDEKYGTIQRRRWLRGERRLASCPAIFISPSVPSRSIALSAGIFQRFNFNRAVCLSLRLEQTQGRNVSGYTLGWSTRASGYLPAVPTTNTVDNNDGGYHSERQFVAGAYRDNTSPADIDLVP